MRWGQVELRYARSDHFPIESDLFRELDYKFERKDIVNDNHKL